MIARLGRFSAVAIAFLCIQTSVFPADPPFENWSHWRGPLSSGASPDATPPTEWSETKNLRWKTPLPGLGHSSPAVWGDLVFVTTSIPIGEPFEPRPDLAPGAHDNNLVSSKWRFIVIAIDRKDGRILWQRSVHEAIPKEGGHDTGSLASASPVTDGERVYAFFGSHGLYALDVTSGAPVWELDLGDMQTKHGHGEGSSPVLRDGRLFVNWDHEGLSFLAALDARTGKKLWREPRDERTSWSSPIVIDVGGAPQLITAATGAIRANDPATGALIWKCSGLSDNVVATPVYDPDSGTLIATSSYNFQSMIAIDIRDAKGDLTDSERILWKRSKRTPYIPSPLLYKGHLYFLAHYQGVLSRVEISSGDEPTGPFRLGELRDIYASPVAADGRLYFVDRSGVTLVLRAGKDPGPLAWNQLNDRFSATPALSGSDLLLRGEKFLYCLGSDN